jgi:type 1 glutamine amidotransferase
MPIVRSPAALRVLVAVGGHPFDRAAFAAIFQDFDDIATAMVDQPAAARLMNPDGMRGFDALLLYDMPGLDFTVREDAPRHVEPPANFIAGFEALLDQGVGIVAMHHALAGWPAWPQYGEYLGGAFLYRPARLRGQPTLDSGYAQRVDYEAVVVADHPVTRRLPARFAVRDELYLAEVFENEVTPLLKADLEFTRERFYSAAAAVAGRMYDNEGWNHPAGSSLIAWTRRARSSPVVYLQPGDGPDAYRNVHLRHLIEDAIRWVARRP